ncbi:hypothetical protein ACRQ5D_10805 [Mucilaginibacter sp. P25]|uniref:hypothetical protein n=1 Tax=Mucilaginibacter sp. P25 TaxID=3423945 RepID=UPI003D7A0793
MEIITNTQDDNLGGLSSLRFAPDYFFSSFNPITFYSGCDWISVECTTESIVFTEKTVDDDNNGYQDTLIAGVVPMIRPEVHTILNKYRRQRCIIECEDQNGYKRRAGITGRLNLLDANNSGTAVADLNSYTITFAGQQLQPAIFI